MDDLIRKYALKNAAEHGTADKSAVIGKVFAEDPELKQQAQDVVARADELLDEINAMTADEIAEAKAEYEYPDEKEDDDSLPDLPDVDEDEGVVMRMAPFPSGMLHIGNARMAVLNDEYVKRYGGTLYLVIDDTAGSEEKKPLPAAYSQIPKDLEWLGVEFDQVLYKSDRMEMFYEYGEQFIEEDWAYVCTCDAETLRDNREQGIACDCRTRAVEDNMDLWHQMLRGDLEQGDAVVRLKTDMQADDPAFRDRVLLRMASLNHPRVGEKYNVWPMLEFSWAIDDHELGMTHIIRGSDLVMEDRMEQYMWDLLGWDHPEIAHHGLLQIEDIKISTSTSKAKIDSGEFTGWEDPRTWSLMSLRKRGFRPEAIRNFVLEFGMSESSVTVPVDSLYTENRKLIDEEADRYFFIEEPITITVEGIEDRMVAEADLHPEDPDRGQREIVLTPEDGRTEVLIEEGDHEVGTELRLKDLCNIRITEDGAEVLDGELQYALDNDLPIVQWLPADDTQDCSIVMPDGTTTEGYCESNLIESDQVIQFIRYGFVRVDSIGDTVSCHFTHR